MIYVPNPLFGAFGLFPMSDCSEQRSRMLAYIYTTPLGLFP